MKKKLILLLLISLITLSITGCDNKSNEEIDRIGNLINGE